MTDNDKVLTAEEIAARRSDLLDVVSGTHLAYPDRKWIKSLCSMALASIDLREQVDVGHQISGSFFSALKPLKLSHINVADPGQHVTELIARLEAAEQKVALESGLRVQLANDSQNHLDRALAAEQRAARVEADAKRYRWAFPILTGTDDKEANKRALALASALVSGLVGDSAIDAAIAALQERPHG